MNQSRKTQFNPIVEISLWQHRIVNISNQERAHCG